MVEQLQSYSQKHEGTIGTLSVRLSLSLLICFGLWNSCVRGRMKGSEVTASHKCWPSVVSMSPLCQECAAAVTQCSEELQERAWSNFACLWLEGTQGYILYVLKWQHGIYIYCMSYTGQLMSVMVCFSRGEQFCAGDSWHTQHKSELREHLWRVLLHFLTSSRGHASKY